MTNASPNASPNAGLDSSVAQLIAALLQGGVTVEVKLTPSQPTPPLTPMPPPPPPSPPSPTPTGVFTSITDTQKAEAEAEEFDRILYSSQLGGEG